MSKGKVITYINEKGGVGKSSICFNVAWELANQGKKILLIDMDAQKANLTFFTGVKKDDAMLTIKEVFSGTDIKETITIVKENLELIPATSKVSLDMTAKLSKFRKAIASIKDEYDYIFIDVNPTPGWSHYLSLSVSDFALVILLPDITSLEASEGIWESIEEIQDGSNPRLRTLGLVFNKNNERTLLSRQVHNAAEAIADRMGTVVFESKIRNSVLLAENIGAHEGITDYDKKSAVSMDIKSLANEIERRC